MSSVTLIVFCTFIGLTHSSPYKMVVIYGIPDRFLNFTVLSMDLDTCLNYCNYNLDTCMAVYKAKGDTNCHVFEKRQLSSVNETDKSEGGIVGIRMDAADSTSCPAKPDENSMTNSGSSMAQYNITVTGKLWKFPPIPVCLGNTKLFERPLGIICMGINHWPYFINQPGAARSCTRGGLAAFETQDEYDYITELWKKMLPQKLPQINNYTQAGIWINGNRKDECKNTTLSANCNGTNEFTFDDPYLSTNPPIVNWAPWQPSGRDLDNSNCLILRSQIPSMEIDGVDDYTCNSTISDTGKSVFIGATPDPYKMVIIFGAPNQFLSYSVQSMEFDACVDYCNNNLDTCMAVYSEQDSSDCQIFEKGQLASVTETDESTGGKVGIRMNTTNYVTCPLNPEENSMTNNGLNMTQYNITMDGTIWRFPPIPYCRTNFTLFSRPKGLWCMGVVLTAPTFLTKSQATSKCSSDYSGSISGLENVDEYNHLVDTVLPILEQDIPSLSPYIAAGFWIDGFRKTACQSNAPASCNGTDEFTFSDPLLSTNPTGYVWGDKQPSGKNSNNSNCIYAQFNTTNKQYQTMGIDDYTCEVTMSVMNWTVYTEYVCGMTPSYLT